MLPYGSHNKKQKDTTSVSLHSIGVSVNSANTLQPVSARLVLRVFNVILLVGGIILIADAALIWSLAEFLHAGLPGYFLFAMLLGLPGLYLIWKLGAVAWIAERELDREPATD